MCITYDGKPQAWNTNYLLAGTATFVIKHCCMVPADMIFNGDDDAFHHFLVDQCEIADTYATRESGIMSGIKEKLGPFCYA